MKHFSPHAIFAMEDLTTATAQYAGKGLIKAGKQIPNRGTLPFDEYK